MNSMEGGIVVTNGAESSLVSEVKEKQHQNPTLHDFMASVHNQRVLSIEQREYGMVKYQGILCIPKVDGLQVRILEEAHRSTYSIHLCSTIM